MRMKEEMNVTNDTKPGKIIIQAGPTTSGKTTRASNWLHEDPDNRLIFDEADHSLTHALDAAERGKDVMMVLTTDVTFEVFAK